ncbi:MAG: ferritin-like protein [Propionibacterium sp.]|nr:ferritin-like protein [Propionibacterium sp.]
MIQLQKALIEDLLPDQPDPAAIATALQHAVELEHATIPTYLYSLYSLVPGSNDAIAEIIDSVVVEEMLHMTLACNVLNAIGRSPVIDEPGFIPTFPGPLPGGVEGQLTVHLRPFSMAQLDTFLEIEEPEDPHHYQALAAAEPVVTIGSFYQAISAAIGRVGESLFVAGPRYQIGPDLMNEAVVVTDVASAQQAITVIVDQGEGTAKGPEETFGTDYAHYYRFQEIQKGRRLVPNPNGKSPDDRYTFSGALVPLDTAGVYPIPDDPARGTYSGQQAFLNDTFNYTYTSLLKALHQLVNGQNTPEQFNRAIGLMMSLKGQARAMTAGLPNPKPGPVNYVGPSFEYQPVEPGPPSAS